MKISIRAIFLVGTCAVIAAAFAGCGNDESSTSTPTPAEDVSAEPTAETPAVTSRAKINSKASRLGTILSGEAKKTIYLFAGDTRKKSMCDNLCGGQWPPVLTAGDPQAGRGIKSGKLGTIEREDGTMQVTYGGHPLYYSIEDFTPEDVLGQGQDAYGAVWYVVSPSGKAIKPKRSAASTDGY